MQRERQFDDQALTARSGWGSIVFDMSMNAREAAKEGISILRNARQHGTSRALLHGDQLAFEQRVKFCPVGDLVRGVFDQHQCGKFVSAEHACLLIDRVGAVWICAG